MQETSLSLLSRLKQRSDSQSWDRLVKLYSPLLYRWLAYYDIQASDADDLVQEVLTTLTAELPMFEHNGRPGAFRAWLRTTLVNRMRDYTRSLESGVWQEVVVGGRRHYSDEVSLVFLDTKTLASAGFDRDIKLWNLEAAIDATSEEAYGTEPEGREQGGIGIGSDLVVP